MNQNIFWINDIFAMLISGLISKPMLIFLGALLVIAPIL